MTQKKSSRGINRRSFLASSAALYALGPRAWASTRRNVFTSWRTHATVFDPTDLTEDPMLVAPMPVRFTPHGCQIHTLFAGDAEMQLRWGESDGRLDQQSEVYRSRQGVTSFVLPMEYEPGGTYRWRVKWRPPGAKRWRNTPEQELRVPKEKTRSMKVIVVGDTHTGIEGFTETGTGERFLYDIVDGYHGNMWSMIRDEQPDMVFFIGDDVGTYDFYMWTQKSADGLWGLLRESQLEAAFLTWRHWRQRVADELGGIPAIQVLGNHESTHAFYPVQNGWSTVAKKLLWPHPTPATFSLGGEDEDFRSRLKGAANLGCHSPMENYFGMRFGRIDFAVLDVMGYTLPGELRAPQDPSEWTYGQQQNQWFKSFLEDQNRWKIVLTHHLTGGAPGGSGGEESMSYGRGGAHYAHQYEQAAVQEAMFETLERSRGVVHLSGHDHNWWHAGAGAPGDVEHKPGGSTYSSRNHVLYLGTGSPSHLPRWGGNPFFEEMFEKRDMFAKGYVRLNIRPGSVEAAYVKSGEPDYWWNGLEQFETRAPQRAVGEVLDNIIYRR